MGQLMLTQDTKCKLVWAQIQVINVNDSFFLYNQNLVQITIKNLINGEMAPSTQLLY